jgi:capsular exopolysaccharide synthesis family protein
MTEQEPKQSALRSYFTVLRRRIVLLGGIIAIAVVAALGLSLLKEDSYSAESAIRFKDLSESLGTVGLFPTQGELPAQTSAQGAEAVTDPRVLAQIADEIGAPGTTADDIESHVSATQEPQSNLINITGTADTAAGAQRLANTAAHATVDVSNDRIRERFSKQADELEKQAAAIKIPSDNPLDLNTEEQAQATGTAEQRKQLLELAAQYRALGEVASVAEIAKTAEKPTGPSNTPPVVAGIVGGILGLILGLIAVAVVESLDRRLHSVDDVQKLVDPPMIGVVLEGGLGTVPSGESPGEEQVAAMNSFRIIRTNLNFLQVDDVPKSVLVTSALAEDGKTTVAVGIALAAAAGGRTLLVEADLHRPVHAQRLGLQEKPGLTDYLAGDAGPQEILQTYEFTDPGQALLQNGGAPERSRLVCITAGTRTPWATELLGSERFKHFLESVKRVYDFVVIDSAPVLGVAETALIVPQVGSVAYCVRLNHTTGDQARAGQEALARLPQRPTGLVVTGVPKGDRGYYSYAYTYGAERQVVKT